MSESELENASPFWMRLGKEQTRQLNSEGFANFKQSIGFKYFNWGILAFFINGFFPLLRHRLSRNWKTEPVESTHLIYPLKRLPPCGQRLWQRLSQSIYATWLSWLLSFVRKSDEFHLLETLPEPLLGNPLFILSRGNKISQDLCNSVHEFYSTQRVKTPLGCHEILEIGAGYGRLAYVFLKSMPRVKYTIVDINPAIAVSYKYLSTVFPEFLIFGPRAIQYFETVREEFEKAQIRFLFPSQIVNVKPKSQDLLINISSFHEMTKEQISAYFLEIERIGKGHFYSKQWRKSRAFENGFRLEQYGYPLGKGWSTVFHERHPIHPRFFHALYRLD